MVDKSTFTITTAITQEGQRVQMSPSTTDLEQLELSQEEMENMARELGVDVAGMSAAEAKSALEAEYEALSWQEQVQVLARASGVIQGSSPAPGLSVLGAL